MLVFPLRESSGYSPARFSHIGGLNGNPGKVMHACVDVGKIAGKMPALQRAA
jgi:hypothetical protein